jgi:predicted nucleotidyltransferase
MRLAELKALAPQLHALLERYGASNLAVFGSVAREQASLFDRADLKLALEELLNHSVDLIRRRNLKPELQAEVEAEAVAL